MQLWDGVKWTSLKHNSKILEGMHLRFVFDSIETLRELNIDQKFSVLVETSTKFMGQQIPGVGRLVDPRQRTIRIESQGMRQTIRDHSLYVDVNIDHNLATELKLNEPLMIDDSGLATGGPITKSGLIESDSLSVEKERLLTGISFVTMSGLSNDFNLKNPLAFLKNTGALMPGQNSLHYKKLSCTSLFNH